jgi:hypothetical protein
MVTATTPDYAEGIQYPSNFGPWILNVAATDNDGEHATYSIPRRDVDVAAPGGEDGGSGAILSTLPGYFPQQWGYAWGTSMAAPHVSGAATLMLAAEPNQLRNFDIEHILKRTARNWPNHSNEIGYGLINIEAALERLQEPYTITHGQAQLNKFIDNQQRTFTAAPAHGLAAGTYWVDGYEFTASASFNFEETPWAWLSVTDKGFSYANPNNAERWMSEAVTPTNMSLATVFYFIRTNSTGQKIDRWVPFDPTVFPTMYTVLGKPDTTPPPPPPPPVDVYITGSEVLMDGQQGEWTAHASGGTGSFTYAWSYRYDASQFWMPIGNTSGYTAWQNLFCSDGMNATIRVVASSGDVDDQAQHHVSLFCVGHHAGDGLPASFALGGNFPNPLTTATEISFAIPEAAHVSLRVYDILGREVASLIDGRVEAGFHTAVLDAEAWPSGVYVYRMEATATTSGEHFTQTRQMTIAR